MKEVYYASVASPIGTIWVAADKTGVCLVSLGGTEQEFLKELSAAGFRHAQVDQEFNRGVVTEIEAFSRASWPASLLPCTRTVGPLTCGSGRRCKIFRWARRAPMRRSLAPLAIPGPAGQWEEPIGEIPSPCSSPATE
jgi:hypothetical protein